MKIRLLLSAIGCQTVKRLSRHTSRKNITQYSRMRAMLFVTMAILPLILRQIGNRCSMPFFSSMSVDGHAKVTVVLVLDRWFEAQSGFAPLALQ
jgi:hypothetical protein